jgi:hypothetical protein
MEENQQQLSNGAHGLSFLIKPFQILTVRVEGVPTVR